MKTVQLDLENIENRLKELSIPKLTTSVWWKLAIALGGILLIMYLFKKTLVKIGLLADGAAEKARKTLEKATLNQLNKSNVNPNFTDFLYQQWADQAYAAMKYSSIAEDEEVVVEVAKHMLNDADIVKWSAAYGTRRHYIFGVPDGSKKTLFDALATDLASKRRKKINEIWKKKGIKTQI